MLLSFNAFDVTAKVQGWPPWVGSSTTFVFGNRSSACEMKLPPGYVPGVGLPKATAYGGFGEKLLKQYGWKDGEGLGAEGGGIKTALKVRKKDDTIGVSPTQLEINLLLHETSTPTL